jgi:ATP phosphoribosyltransferase regulatory subunit
MSNPPPALARRLPYGLNDLFYAQAAGRVALERALEETLSRWGYQRIILPTFEYYETLTTGASPHLREEMYRFFDRDGQALALRPDMTVPTARLVASKLYDQALPLRFYYVGSVFRYEEPQAGRRREFTQAGIELIGAGTPEADAEALALAVETLRALRLANFQLNLGQVAFLRALLHDAGLDHADTTRLELAIDRKNDVALQVALGELGISAAAARAIRAIPHLYGDQGVLAEAARLATSATARVALDHLAAVYALLAAEGVAEHVILDLGEMRSMDYYTGIVFHGYVANLGFPICSGGRYDTLMASFGLDTPAVGFALSVERVMLVAPPQVDIAPHLVMSSCAHAGCRTLAALARSRGLRVEVDVLGRRDEALCAYARARGAHHALSCRDSETFTLADVHSQRTVTARQAQEEILQWG